MRQLLLKKGFQFPALLDVDWRLDYIVETSTLQGNMEPLYTLKFKFNTGESTMFSCTVEQLQDLYQKLNDACKQVPVSQN
jgi:hypothetical protein